jgi:hypothetical protein
VCFHFGKEHRTTLTVLGTNEENVLERIFDNKEYFDGKQKEIVGIRRVNLSLVTYVSVWPA